MRLMVAVRFVLVLGLCSSACSLLVDSSNVDAGCTDEEKLCFGRCVPKHDPAYNCRADLCTACELENAIPKCDGDVCAVDVCLDGFGCPGTLGCSVNLLTSEEHCGTCNNQCDMDYACRDGVCTSRAEGLGGAG